MRKENKRVLFKYDDNTVESKLKLLSIDRKTLVNNYELEQTPKGLA